MEGQVRCTPKPKPEGNLVSYLMDVIDCGSFEIHHGFVDTSLLE